MSLFRKLIFFMTVIFATAQYSFAQQTRAILQNYNNSNITANGVGAITGALLNGFNNSFILSTAMLNDTNVFSGSNTFTINPQLSGCVGFPYSSGNAPITCSTTIQLGVGAAAINLGGGTAQTGILVGNGTSAATGIPPGSGVAAALALPVTGAGGIVLQSSPILTGQTNVVDSALATSVAGLGSRGNLFVWSNCGPNAAGQNCGEQIWVGNNPTATPGVANPEALLVAITNGNNRVGSYGVNILAGVCGPADAAGCTTSAGFLGGPIDSFEDDVSASASFTNSNRAFNATNGASFYANGPESYSQGLGQPTAAFSAWSTKADGSNWWHEGVVISRVSDIGLHIVVNPSGSTDTGTPYSVASIQDDSSSGVLLGNGAVNTLGLGKALAIRSANSAGIIFEGNGTTTGGYMTTDGASYMQLQTSSPSIVLILGNNNVEKFRINSTVIELEQTVDFHYAGTTTCTVTGSIAVQINGLAHQIPYC